MIVYKKKVYLHVATDNEQWIIWLILSDLQKWEILVQVFLCTYTHVDLHDCAPQYSIHLEMSFVHACTPWYTAACTSYYSLLLFLLKLTYINQGHPHYNLHSRRQWDKWFLDDNKRSKMNKVFRTLTRMCTRLNRCSYRGHVGKIFLDSSE